MNPPPPDPIHRLLADHIADDEQRMGRLEKQLGQVVDAISRRDSTTGKDREMGRAWRYAALVAAAVVAIVFTAFQVQSAISAELEREITRAGHAKASDVTIGLGDVKHELELMRREDSQHREQLGRSLQRIDGRLDALEKRR